MQRAAVALKCRPILASRGLAVALFALLSAVAVGAARVARAQRLESNRARTLVVGDRRGPSPQERVDGARTGESRAPLPTGTLRIAWRRSLSDSGSALALGPPLVDDRGDVTIVTPRGDVFVLASDDGTERSHVALGQRVTSGAALLSDGTAVVLTILGDAVGARYGAVRFKVHVGAGASATPLALDDGGFVVATRGELVSLDGTGEVRARAPVDEDDPVLELVGPLATREGPTVYAVSASGDVVGWVPASGREATRIASFGGAVDGEAALVRGASPALVGVVEHALLVAIDPVRGTVTTRAAAATVGALDLLGPPAVDPRGNATLLALSATRTLAVTFDPNGVASLHQSVGPTSLPPLPDGGTALTPVAAHLGPLVDTRGAVAFTLPSGEVGALTPSGGLDVTSVCSRTPAGPTFAGLAPAGPSSLVVACGASYVARIEGVARP